MSNRDRLTNHRWRPSSLLRWLTVPTTSDLSIEARRYSQMLMLLLSFMIPLSALTGISAVVITGDKFFIEPFFILPTALLACYVVAYGLGKTGRWKAGTVIFIAPIYIGVWAAIIFNPEPRYIGFETMLGLLLMPVLFTGLFYHLRILIITAAGNLLVTFFIPMLIGVPLLSYYTILILVTAVSMVAIVAIHHRNMIEKERLAELQERESRLAKTEEMAHIGSWDWDLETDKLAWSSEEYHILGYNTETPVTLEMFMKRVHPDDRERIEQANRDILNAEQSVITEFRILHPEGGERQIYSIAEPIRDENGKVIRVVGFEQDVTEQVEFREELRKAKEAAEEALRQVKQLRGLLPICSYCKKIRRDDDAWEQLEHYITKHSEAEFSHGVCPECYAKHIVPQLEKGGQPNHSHPRKPQG